MTKFIDTLALLQNMVESQPKKFIFFAPADLEKINAFENQYGVFLPEEYKSFLLKFNGGFINYDGAPINLQEKVKVNVGWGYNQFLGIEDIAIEYQAFLDEDEFISMEEVCYKSFIPFMLTDNAEKLSFNFDILSHQNSSNVYDCFHEVLPKEWKVLYSSFDTMLRDYISCDGEINLVAS